MNVIDSASEGGEESEEHISWRKRILAIQWQKY
jgi:hypothetical protein